MSRKTWFFGAVLLVLFVVACGPSEEEVASAAQAEAWTALQEEHAVLVGLRGELTATRAEIDAGPEGDEDTGLSPEEQAMQLEEKAAEQEAAVNEKADAFSTTLVGFINEHAGFQGEETNDVQGAAIRLKSDEDIELAREYVTKGGDYKRALDIVKNAAVVDPDNAKLQEVIIELEELRYMDEDRFALVKKSMSEAQVRAAIGQVFHGNVRGQGEITYWLYPKEEGAASSVYFREVRGQLSVYETNFNAVKTAVERAEQSR
jgi:hypothetical protein